MNSLNVGKLPTALLRNFLDKIEIEDEQVVLGPRIGEDAAVIRCGGKLLVAKTDPVTFATDFIGWYVVHVNANDIATMGVKPRWFLATILLPAQSTHQEAERIFDQILSACDSLGITLVGGHTEVTHNLKRPVVVGCMLAEAEDRPLITTSGAKVGDDVVLTKGIAIEGTAVLAREAEQDLLSAGLSRNLTQRAAGYLFAPGISVLREALTACSAATVNSMHDPTEGGLATGLWEIATAAQVGILVEEKGIRILAECKVICEKLGLDPLGLLASGTLIVTLPCSETSRLLEALRGIEIDAAIIGKVVEAKDGLKMRTATGMQDLPQFERDELARFLDSDEPSTRKRISFQARESGKEV
jgi:hydrogenase maturation factor